MIQASPTDRATDVTNTDLTHRLRRHAATFASDLLAVRSALDAQLAGVPPYSSAIASIADGVGQLNALATNLDRGMVMTRGNAGGTVGLPSHGDLVDGEIVTGAGDAG